MALVNRGIAFWNVGQSEEAIVDCTRVIELETGPKEGGARALSGWSAVLFQQAKWDEGLAKLDSALPASQGYSVPLTAWATIYIRTVVGASDQTKVWAEVVPTLAWT